MKKSGNGPFGVICVALAISLAPSALKAAGAIDCPWWIATLPLWLGPALLAAFGLVMAIKAVVVAIADGKADVLRAMIDRLKAIGAEPPVAQASAPAQPESTSKKAAPICPDHGKPMKPSRKPGGWFCPRRTGDGDYCPHGA